MDLGRPLWRTGPVTDPRLVRGFPVDYLAGVAAIEHDGRLIVATSSPAHDEYECGGTGRHDCDESFLRLQDPGRVLRHRHRGLRLGRARLTSGVAASSRSEPGVHRLGLEREDGEHALVDAPQRLAPGDPVERLEPERVLALRHRALVPKPRCRSRPRLASSV